MEFDIGSSTKRGDPRLADRRANHADRCRRAEREKRGHGLGLGVKMDQLRSSIAEGIHRRPDEEHSPRPAGHAVLPRKRQGSPVRDWQRRLPADHHRDTEVLVRSGDHHAKGRRSTDAEDSAAEGSPRDTVRDRWMERQKSDEFHRNVRHSSGSVGQGKSA